MVLPKRILLVALLAAASLPLSGPLHAQHLFDVSAGSSSQDYFSATLAFRKAFSDRFRLGLEAQLGAVRYRFISAQPIRKGYSFFLGVPILYRLYQSEHIRLDLYTRVGVRFQGVIDPDGNDERDQVLASTGVHFEPGLVVSAPLSHRLTLQGGVTLPNVFEIAPQFLFENNATVLSAGLAYRATERRVFFVKASTGPAAGADGDSQKYTWSAQAGVRFRVGKQGTGNPLVLEPGY
jgi:hypothetical protein